MCVLSAQYQALVVSILINLYRLSVSSSLHSVSSDTHPNTQTHARARTQREFSTPPSISDIYHSDWEVYTSGCRPECKLVGVWSSFCACHANLTALIWWRYWWKLIDEWRNKWFLTRVHEFVFFFVFFVRFLCLHVPPCECAYVWGSIKVCELHKPNNCSPQTFMHEHTLMCVRWLWTSPTDTLPHLQTHTYVECAVHP